MRRAVKLTSLLALFAIAWVALMLEAVPGLAPLSPNGRWVVSIMPLWALIAFGAYSLAMISINLIQFRDCPEAARELQEQMGRARADLTSKGFKFD